jgi:hypothetical protein
MAEHTAHAATIPQMQPHAPDQPPPDQLPRGSGPKRAVAAGFALGVLCIMLMLLPLVWGRSSINKYFVAFGFLGTCVSISFVAHGGWDWFRGRGRGHGRGRG